MITVQPGDTLSRLAFENNTTVVALVEANADRYPSLRDRPGLIEVGWLLRLPSEFSPGEVAAPKPRYTGLRFGLEEAARGGQVEDGIIQSLQRDLRALGYYGSRLSITGRFGPNTMGGVLALKYDLIHTFGTPPDEIGYPAVDPVEADELYAASTITPAFELHLRAMLAGETTNGVLPWLLPTHDDVPDADQAIYDMVMAEYQTGLQEGRPFPHQLFTAILGKESGGEHFDSAGNVKYGVDWVGARAGGEPDYADIVEFNPDNESAPWIKSRGWGLTQYTPYLQHDLPRPMPDYILSVQGNLRTAIDLFRTKFTYGQQNPCNFPSRETPEYRCAECLSGWDPTTYTRREELPCSWLLAVWAYNGLTDASFQYMTNVVRHVQAAERDLGGPPRPAPVRPKPWLAPEFGHRRGR